MKKIVYLLALVGAVFTGCNPIEDINNDLDAQANPIVGNDEFKMTSDDYANVVLQGSTDPVDYYESNENFSSVDDAKDMLPDFLSRRYPYWGNGSSVMIHYDLNDGNPEEVSAYTNATVYQLASADYITAASNAFFPTEDPYSTFEATLAANIASPTVGDVVRVEYKQFTEDPIVGLTPIVEYNFDGTFEGWTIVDVTEPTLGWTSRPTEVQASGFSGGNNVTNDWLVSPTLDLTAEADLTFQMNQRISFLNGELMTNHINVYASTDYAGDVNTATWNPITLATAPDGTSSAYVLSEDYDFSAYDGQMVTLAFKYDASLVAAPLWRVDQASIKTIGYSGNTETKSAYYVYTDTGNWDLVDSVYYLTNGDYDSMGESSGQPGQFNNFSGSVAPENYLPQFLAMAYPFAQEGDELFMIYKYFGGSGVGTVIKGNLYTVTDGSWVPSIASLQFGFENGLWVPDNTIKYVLATSDYSLVASSLLTTPGFEAAAGNLDNFGNFNRTGGSTTWTDDMMGTALGIVLDNLDPSAAEGQKYLMTFNMYNGSNGTEDFKLIKAGGEWVLNN